MTHARCLLPLLLAIAVGAQQAQAPAPAPVRRPAPVLSLEFDGGSMADLVAAIRKVEPRANIILQRDATVALVPAMEIKEAGLDQILESACAVAEIDGQIGCSEEKGNGEPIFSILVHRRSTVPPRGNAPQTSVDTNVLSLNRLTAGYPEVEEPGLKVETILSAIEAGCSFDGAPPTLRYHEDSKLLFLHGERAQLALAGEVLRILERDLQERASAARDARQRAAPATTGPGQHR